ncbi:hypothetical protein T01_12986 [Trichinella spiralis]|uniref:Uncharacterized protein n=1 Tax=Trichinella spiralis TaxID=6334 RepID=A0A0V1B526_TRISP|nr:hypothetical protein T01_12986 [Trichinella spiralis]
MTSCLARERAPPAPAPALGRRQNAKNAERIRPAGAGRLSTTIYLTNIGCVEIDQFDES